MKKWQFYGTLYLFWAKYKGNETGRGFCYTSRVPWGNVLGLISRFSIDGGHHCHRGPLRS